jgi:hypothetical protein
LNNCNIDDAVNIREKWESRRVSEHMKQIAQLVMVATPSTKWNKHSTVDATKHRQ